VAVLAIARALKLQLDGRVIAIDHIGSTSSPDRRRILIGDCSGRRQSAKAPHGI
jgi:GrpB-like predicted nucleotidyltransferase (UPF0157 family)